MTPDELALSILLSDAPESERRAKLRALTTQALIIIGGQCPSCGGRETEDNGYGEHRCCACDCRWGGSA